MEKTTSCDTPAAITFLCQVTHSRRRVVVHTAGMLHQPSHVDTWQQNLYPRFELQQEVAEGIINHCRNMANIFRLKTIDPYQHECYESQYFNMDASNWGQLHIAMVGSMEFCSLALIKSPTGLGLPRAAVQPGSPVSSWLPDPSIQGDACRYPRNKCHVLRSP